MAQRDAADAGEHGSGKSAIDHGSLRTPEDAARWPRRIARVQRSWWQNNRSVGNESTHAMLKQGMRLTGK